MSYTYCDPPMAPCPHPWAYPWTCQTSAAPHTVPSVMEQMGADPISKLAAAIERLADALNSRGGGTEV